MSVDPPARVVRRDRPAADGAAVPASALGLAASLAPATPEPAASEPATTPADAAPIPAATAVEATPTRTDPIIRATVPAAALATPTVPGESRHRRLSPPPRPPRP